MTSGTTALPAAALARLQNGDAGGAVALLTRDDTPADGAAAAMARQAALGMALLADRRPEAARVALRAAIALGATDPVTRLNLALAEAQSGDTLRAAQLIDELEAACPDWDEPPLRRAELARRAAARLDAEDAYRQVLALNPARREALLALGTLLLERRAADEAAALLKRCCALYPDCDQAWDALGLTLMLQDSYSLAEAAFTRARRLRPQQIDYALHCAEAALQDGRGAEAEARFAAECEADPLNIALLVARAELLSRLGRRSDAADVLELATTLAPDEKIPAARHAMLLSYGLQQYQAEAAMRRALKLDPDNADLGIALSVILVRLQRHVEARDLLQDLVARLGEDAALLCNQATVAAALGLQDEARALAERGTALAPHHFGTWRTLTNILPYCPGIGGADLLATARTTAALVPRLPEAPFAFGNDPDPDRRLRIGVLSGTLKIHPVGWLTVAGFEALDPAGFEVILLRQQVATDFIARRFESTAAEIHDVSVHDDPSLVAFVRAQRIDVLIDLSGWGDFGRMASCASRLAPVQVKWVGMQHSSTGLAEMDWMIADRWEIPPDCERFYCERPLRLADGYVCYSPPPDAPDVAALPALAQGHVTFGCYNNLAKLTPVVLATWSAILHRVPGARLLLKTHQFNTRETCDRLHGVFAGHGIAPDRIEFRGSSPHRELLAQYGDVDIVLDPFPYAGGLTTCEALWMGVPTITFPGESFAARHSFSHLSNLGLTDWIAYDIDGYQDLAVAKAGDLASLASLRQTLRARMKASPLCDAPRFGRSLGDGLRIAWRDWCGQQEARKVLS